jgi:hypothetical protein
MGPRGPAGAPGPAGTFSGTFSGPTFTGAVDMRGATSVALPPAAGVTLGGLDLFTAAMTGTYPAVLGVSEQWATSIAGFSCGAPTALDFDIPTASSNQGQAGIANAAFGRVVFTRGGAFDMSQGTMASPPPFTTPCANLCFGPVTFFLISPVAQVIDLGGSMDDGPSPIYINGAVAVADATANMSVPIPQGAFSISFEACSNNGPTIAMWINTPFITQYGLEVDFDSTFHRNGK